MIPVDFITEWREHAPWIQDHQVEQDLILSRAAVELFQRPEVSNLLVFRGGTALYKLFLVPSARYSEDLDLVQIGPGPVGKAIDAIRAPLDPWLGSPKRTWTARSGTVVYRMASEGSPAVPMRLKIEINTGERSPVLGFEANLRAKVADAEFGRDVDLLLAPGTPWDIHAAAEYVLETIVPRFPR